MITAVDTSTIIDVLEPDPDHGPSSREALRRCLHEGSVVACDVLRDENAIAFGHAQAGALEALRKTRCSWPTPAPQAMREASPEPTHQPHPATRADAAKAKSQRLTICV